MITTLIVMRLRIRTLECGFHTSTITLLYGILWIMNNGPFNMHNGLDPAIAKRLLALCATPFTPNYPLASPSPAGHLEVLKDIC